MAGFELPRAAIERLAGSMSDEQARVLSAYGNAVVDVGREMSLVSSRSLGRLGEHFIDSAAVLSVLGALDGDLADLGSGAGFPGVVVAVLRPEVRVSVIDSRRSKIVFLKRVKRELRLGNLEVVHGRLEDLAGERRYGVAVSRALGSVEDTLRASLALVAAGGRLVLFKGPGWAEEARGAAKIAGEAGFEVAGTTVVDLPGVGRATTFVEFATKGGVGTRVPRGTCE